MRISKKDLVTLVKQNLQEMPMDFPQTVSVKKPNPDFDPDQEESLDNPKMIDAEVPFNERPHQDLQRKLQRQDTPLKKVPMPADQGNQNFQEKLASETYKEVIRRVKQATHQQGNNLLSMMMSAVYEIDNIESNHREELERLAVTSVFDIFKIPHDSFNVYAKLISVNDRSGINTRDFLHAQNDDQNPEAPDVDNEPISAPEINSQDEASVEEDYVDKLENFDLERAKRRLINAMTQGAAHSAYNLYNYFSTQIKDIVGPLPNGADIMDLYAVMMSVNDTNYWHMSDQQIVNLQSSVAGKADVKFPEAPNDGEGGDDGEEGEEGGDDEQQTDTLGNPYDPSKPQVFITGINFPVLFHEAIKGIQKVIAGHGATFPGYDASNPRHVDFIEQVKRYEDVLEYEMWDLRLGPAIWQRYRQAHPSEIVDPDEKIELQGFVQSYIYKLPARKFLSLMKEIMGGTQRARTIVATLVSAIERMLADEDYQEALSAYNDEVDDIDDDTSDDDLMNLLGNIPGIRLSDDNDEEDEDDDDGGEYVPRR
jgi:hypothetical protein